MKINAYNPFLKIFILSNGKDISKDDYPEFRVGMELEFVDGKYRPKGEAGCGI